MAFLDDWSLKSKNLMKILEKKDSLLDNTYMVSSTEKQWENSNFYLSTNFCIFHETYDYPSCFS